MRRRTGPLILEMDGRATMGRDSNQLCGTRLGLNDDVYQMQDGQPETWGSRIEIGFIEGIIHVRSMWTGPVDP